LDVPSWRQELEKSRNRLAEVSGCQAFEKLDYRRVCFCVDETFRALGARDAASSAPARLEQEITQKGGLADPGFAGDADHPQIAASALSKEFVQFLQLVPAPYDSLCLGERAVKKRQSLRGNFVAHRVDIALPGDGGSWGTSRARDPPGIDLVLESVDGVLLGVRVAAYW
jgi:hypothetical protein